MLLTFAALGLTVFSCLGGDSVHVTEAKRRNIILTAISIVSIFVEMSSTSRQMAKTKTLRGAL